MNMDVFLIPYILWFIYEGGSKPFKICGMNTEKNPSSDLRFTGYQAAMTHGAISDLINLYVLPEKTGNHHGWVSRRFQQLQEGWGILTESAPLEVTCLWLWINTYRRSILAMGWTSSLTPAMDRCELPWTTGVYNYKVLTHPHML